MRKISEYKIDQIPQSEQTKKISVCVAVYNSKDYLRKSICSILAQTYKNLEVILVDDGSSDGSELICDEFAEKDERVRVIHKQNGGLYTSRNVGIEAATGDFICFMDGDDYIDPTMYSNMLQAIIQEDADLAVCRYRQVYEDEIVDKSTPMAIVFDGSEILEQFLKEDEAILIQNSAWNKLYKKSMIEDLRFPARWYEDMLYTPSLLSLPSKSVYLDQAYHNYICSRSSSIMNMGINSKIFSDLIPNLYDRAIYLESIGRHDLRLISDYHLYKKLLGFVDDVYSSNDKNKDKYLKSLDEKIRVGSTDFKEIFSISFANQNLYRRLKLYLRSPRAYHTFMKVNKKAIIPVKQAALKILTNRY